METSEQINELAKALAAAQGEIQVAAFDKTNPHFGSDYATLASVWESCRKPLSKHGLAVIQSIGHSEVGVLVESMLVHISGQFVRSRLTLMPRDKSPQSVGSASTYARRYSLMALVGVAPGDESDDDGNAAQGTPQPRPQAPAPVKPVQPVAPVKTKKSLFDEIMKIAEQLNAVSELPNLSQEWFKKEAKELTVKELETFLENMQAELGRSGKMQ